MKVVILAKSSSGIPHHVEFVSDNATVRVFCNCQAGIHRQMCKHKKAFILGDERMLHDYSQAGCLKEIQHWPNFEMLHSRLRKCEFDVNQISEAIEALKHQITQIKAEFAQELIHGQFSVAEGFTCDVPRSNWEWVVPDPIYKNGKFEFRANDVFHKRDNSESIQILKTSEVRFQKFTIHDGKYIYKEERELPPEALIDKLKKGL